MRQSTKAATLILEDGTRFEGRSFGHHGSTSGEVVFNTAMTGYPESLTDPSYEGQILITTYPILGSYGVPPEGKKDSVSRYYESERIHCRAIVAQDYSWDPSHWQADRSLAQWLRDEKIPGIFGVDTRALTKHLRDKGSMLGKIIVEGCGDVDFHDPNLENLVATNCWLKPPAPAPTSSNTVTAATTSRCAAKAPTNASSPRRTTASPSTPPPCPPTGNPCSPT